MDAINFFDGHEYFKDLTEKNKLAKANAFFPCSCSGINSLQDVLENFRKQSAFVCIDDTNDASTEQIGGGWFKKRTFTVFLLIRYKFDDMKDRAEKLDICRHDICRQIFRQFHSRMIRDKYLYEDMDKSFLNVSRIYARELGEYFISGCTGLYFMTEISEPINLCYKEDEWDG